MDEKPGRDDSPESSKKKTALPAITPSIASQRATTATATTRQKTAKRQRPHGGSKQQANDNDDNEDDPNTTTHSSNRLAAAVSAAKRATTSDVNDEENRPPTPTQDDLDSSLSSAIATAVVDTNTTLPTASVIEQARLVNWFVNILDHYLQRIVDNNRQHHSFSAVSADVQQQQQQQQQQQKQEQEQDDESFESAETTAHTDDAVADAADAILVVDQVVEFIEMPEFDNDGGRRSMAQKKDSQDRRRRRRRHHHHSSPLQRLGSHNVVLEQLRSFVSQIAALYRNDNPFHNFEHASHVTMSATRILNALLLKADHDGDDDDDGGGGGDHHLKETIIMGGGNDDELQQPANKRRSSDKGGSSSTITTSSKPQATTTSMEETHPRRRHYRHHHVATFGISSDPMMQFALVFAALIHDVDHTGLTNQQLLKNRHPLASQYRGRSVAEQHSIHVAWNIFMTDQYRDLRHCIYRTDQERQRFRQLVINAVIATDIADAGLQARRKQRWIEAFGTISNDETDQTQNPSLLLDSTQKKKKTKKKNTDGGGVALTIKQQQQQQGQRAILFLELFMQASDSAHTMQHWQVYRKWNQHLFDERYAAHVQGKVAVDNIDDEDPSLKWYQNELWFIDNYVIPLAKSFQHCQALESLGTEFVNYAMANRREWEAQGESIVQDMVAAFRERR